MVASSHFEDLGKKQIDFFKICNMVTRASIRSMPVVISRSISTINSMKDTTVGSNGRLWRSSREVHGEDRMTGLGLLLRN